MKRLLLTVSFIFCCVSGFAAKSTFTNLVEVNAQWKNQHFDKALLNQIESNQNVTFNDWIATHLMLVEKTLRTRDISLLSQAQQQNRTSLLNELNGYWHARPFPVNDYLPYKNPVFIDRKGNHCAVGYLMQQSGAEALARQIDAEQKFGYIHEIKTKSVREWATENGFTLNELAWIQPGYPPAFSCQSMAGGLNGSVNSIVIDPANGTIYAGGNFTENNDAIPCNHLAVYLSGFAGWFWTSIGDGVNGNVHTMLIDNNKLYVGGEFTMAGSLQTNHIAVYDLQTYQWSAIGSLDGTVKTLAMFNNQLYAGGSFTEMLSKWDGTQWQDVNQGYFYGTEVRALESIGNQLYVGGDFELPTGALRKNVVKYDGTQFQISGFGTPTPVNDFEVYKGNLYAACDYIQNTDTCALTVLDTNSGDWFTVLGSAFGNGISSYFQGTIKNMLNTNNGLVCGGNFQASYGMTYGNNLMRFEITPTDTLTMPLLVIDTTINAMILSAANTLCFGGEFVASYSTTLNHIAQMDVVTGIEKRANRNLSLSLYPNPVQETFILKAKEQLISYSIFDINGREVMKNSLNGLTQTISVRDIPTGIYSLKVEMGNGTEQIRFVKN